MIEPDNLKYRIPYFGNIKWAVAISSNKRTVTCYVFIFQKSTAIHEFGHALGMAHEQSRQDRDKHLTINFDNIEEDKKYNLEKEVTLDKNPYDYYSVMQYELKVIYWLNLIG